MYGQEELYGLFVEAIDDRSLFSRFLSEVRPIIVDAILTVASGAVCEADIDDLVQETWIKIYRGRHLYRPDKSSITTWVFSIAKNISYDFLRKGQKLSKLEQRLKEEKRVHKHDVSGSERLEMAFVGNLVMDDLSGIVANPALYFSLVLVYAIGLETATVAEMLGMNPNTFRSMLADGVKSIRQEASSGFGVHAAAV